MTISTEAIISAAIEVHRHIGPGLLESVYEECLDREFTLRNISFKRQVAIPVRYKGLQLPHGHRLDFLIAQSIVVELKAVETLLPVHKAQLLSYLRLVNWPLGLLINFNEARLVDGVRRITLRLPDP